MIDFLSNPTFLKGEKKPKKGKKMATRIYAIAPGTADTTVIEGVGAAASAYAINLVVDIATTIVNEGTTTRVVKQAEVLEALERLKIYIMRDNSWPPA